MNTDNLNIAPLDEKEDKKRIVEQQFIEKISKLTSNYTTAEQKTWSTQLQEALAYKADNTAPTPMLTEIADGGDIGILADKIIAKATYLKVESGKLLAEKNRKLKALEDESASN